MRNILLTLAGAGAALALAAPASAQFYRAYAPPVYGYGYNTAGIARSMEARVANIRGQVRSLEARGLIRWNRARNLDREAFSLQRSVQRSAWNGLSPGEARSLDIRIANLERRVATSAYRPRYAPRYIGYRY